MKEPKQAQGPETLSDEQLDQAAGAGVIANDVVISGPKPSRWLGGTPTRQRTEHEEEIDIHGVR